MVADSPQRAPRGARTLVLAQVAKAGVLLLGLVVLSRLLTPAEFGLVAVPLALVGVGEILRDMGLSAAATTAKTLPPTVRDVLFWTNVGIGVVLALGAVVGGWIYAAISGDPTALPLMAALASIFVVNGIGAQYRASLTRDMRFSQVAVVDTLAGVLGLGVAILLAMSGFGFWALIAQPIVVAVVTAGMSVFFGRWRPSLPRDFAAAKPVLGFGASVAWSQSLQYLGNNADTFMLGIWATRAQLGFYTKSFQLAIQPLGLLKAPLTSIALPVLSRQVDDPERFERNVLTGQRLLSYSIVPLAVLLSAAAHPIVLVVLGEQWAFAIPLVGLLALAGALQQLVSVSNWIFMARNEGRSLRRFSTVSVIIKVVLIVIAAPFGPIAVALAYLASAVLMAPTVFIWACRVGNLRTGRAVKDLVPALCLLAAAGSSAYAVSQVLIGIAPIWQLLASCGAFLVPYALGMLIPRVRREIADVVALVLRRR